MGSRFNTMRYFRIERDNGESLVIERGGNYRDVTTVNDSLDSFRSLVQMAAREGQSLQAVSESVYNEAPELDPAVVQADMTRPISPDEVWGAGVTYAISQESREGEGGLSDTYLNAYEADRPEVYFKATPSRTVGPNADVGIRGDSSWDVAEPELSIILFDGEIVGYTVGNDMCSREIERDNLLYLPQSKIYKKSCAVGPCIADVDDPHDLTMKMTYLRDEKTIFEGETSTAEMVRSCEELTSYFTRHNEVPELAVLLTGTSIIPSNDVSLQANDTVQIEIEDIGTLENTVREV
jgi:2-dehydro-3-deoxy-D-arabinonate dehydratase